MFDGYYQNFEDIFKHENKQFCKKFLETAFKKKNLCGIESLIEEYT